MSSNKITYFEIGEDKDNPLFKIEYLEESKTIKKEDNKLSVGYQYQVGTITDSKGKKLEYESRFSVFDASLEYLFDTIGHTLLKGGVGFVIETLAKTNFAVSQNTKVKTKDKAGHDIVFSIDAVGGVFPYSVQVESIDGKKFVGKLPQKIEDYIYKFNDLNRALKDIKRNPTYDRPKYFYSGLYEEIFSFEKLISEETIEFNNDISKKTEVNINTKKFLESEYDIDQYHIKEENYENIAKSKGTKISIGNIEQYQTVTRGKDSLFLSNTFSMVEYDPKNLSKYGINALEHKFIEKMSNTLFGNLIKSVNITLMSDVKTTFKDKNGNTVEATLKLFGCNFLCSMKIDKINGKEVTKIPTELMDITNKYNKPLSGIKYYIDNREKDISFYKKLVNFMQVNYKRTLDAVFNIQDQIKEIDVTRKDNLEYISDYKLQGKDREYKGIKIRTEKGAFTRADKATFTSADGYQIEVKINSYFNKLYPTLTINSINGQKQHIITPLNVYLKDNSIDELMVTAKNIIENKTIELENKSYLSNKEKDKLLSITNKQLDNVVSKAIDNIPNIILKEFIKRITKDTTKQINEHALLNHISNDINEITISGKLTKETIQGLYNQNPNLQTIINNGKRINVMDYIDESLDDKIFKAKEEYNQNQKDNKQKTQNEQTK